MAAACWKDGKQVRKILFRVANQLTQDDLSKIKFLLESDIPKAKLENVTNATDLMSQILEQFGTSQKCFDNLEEILTDIKRSDLIPLLNGELPKERSPEEKKEKLNQLYPEDKLDKEVLDYLSRALNADWKRLCRFLDVSDEDIDNIDRDFHKISEKAYEGIRFYLKNSNEESVNHWGKIKQILDKLPRKDIVRHIEVKILGNSSRNQTVELPPEERPQQSDSKGSVSLSPSEADEITGGVRNMTIENEELSG